MESESKSALALFAASVAAIGALTYLSKHDKARKEAELKSTEDRIAIKRKATIQFNTQPLDEFQLKRSYPLEHISHVTTELVTPLVSPLLGDGSYRSLFGGDGFLMPANFVPFDEYALANNVFHESAGDSELLSTRGYLRAGPRINLFFKPSDVRAAIVTCGGLCPGLNVVIREIVMTLYYNYGVKQIFGVPYGYRGFYDFDWRQLIPSEIAHIHLLGGTILGSSRGGFDLDKIIDSLLLKGINQVYVVGGDGTHRGIWALHQEIRRRGLKISVIGVPKTIDNDISIIDKSFGFDTAVEEAQRAIQSANVESRGALNGIGLVKLMGRTSGYIAMHSALSSRDVNLCLIPEAPFEMKGDSGVLEFIRRRLQTRGHCVIVVAEGAGESILDADLQNRGTDASGNAILADVGRYLKGEIENYGKAHKMDITLKFLDPTYMIRTVPANASDRLYCSILAQNAVHGAFAGFTGFTVGCVNGRHVYIPIEHIASQKPNRVDVTSRMWQRLLASTGQPAFLSKDTAEKLRLAKLELEQSQTIAVPAVALNA
eukprot:GILJ01003175.1.p1 GENE.GILJ01003175.1~~GILJ01003175.1.p1  ORF type:complete len:544 (-),score=79.01 GILJ01003175.1:135-1766(-)